MKQPLKIICSVTLATTLAACASPRVDKTPAQFSETQYTTDLNDCRGGGVVVAAVYGLGAATYGSAVGAVQGAYYGLIAGDWDEGAAIGAAVGGVVGFGLGATGALDKQKEEVESCLVGKGYSLKTI